MPTDALPTRAAGGRRGGGQQEGPRPLALILLATACFASLAAAYAFWVRTRFGQRADQDAFDGRTVSPVAYDAAGAVLATISVGSLVLALIAIAGQALVRGRRWEAAVAVAVVTGALLISEALKRDVLRRPPLIDEALHHYANSFPSGHTTIAFGLGVAALLTAPAGRRRAVATAACLYGAAIGVATITAGWHRPSDVVGGMLVVVGWTALVVLAALAVDRRALSVRADDAPAARSLRGPRDQLAIALAAVTLGWLAAIAVAVAERASRLDLTGVTPAFVFACASIVALAAVLIAALELALRSSLPRR